MGTCAPNWGQSHALKERELRESRVGVWAAEGELAVAGAESR